MKKRLLCLLLCLLMCLSVVLTACSNKEEEENADVDTDTGAKTITMRLMSEKKVCNTDEELAAFLAEECGGDEESQKYKDMLKTRAAYDAVEAEFTKITKSDFKVNVDLLFYTEEEYYDMLRVTMEEYAITEKQAQLAERTLEKYIEDYLKAYPGYKESLITNEFYKYFPEYEQYRGYSSDDEEAVFEEQYRENELGIKELVYPETMPNQLDIIYLSGLDMYNEYIEEEWLASLEEQINTTGKMLNDYISSALLNGVKKDGATYAIPNNIMIGEYTYMFIDKQLFDQYYHDYEDINNLLDCKNFLSDVATLSPEILPIDATIEECMSQFVWHWNIERSENDFGGYTYSVGDKDKFSVLGAVYGGPQNIGRGRIELGFNSLFTLDSYREIFLTLKEYEFNNYYKAENEQRSRAAITFGNGNYDIKREAEENNGVYTDENGNQYYTVVVKYPEADEYSLYGNMFAVSANSKNTVACIQVLTLLNTNAKLRNILQYGIEGVNYAIDEDTNTLVRLNKDYEMDIEKTGNCFIAYPEEGLPMNYWEDAKSQNNEALINPLLGFDFDTLLAEYDAKLDNNLLNSCDILTSQTLAKINDCDTYDELYDLVTNKATGFVYTLDPANSITIMIEGYADPVGVNFKKITNKAYDTATGGGVDGSGAPIADTNGESPYTVYYNWLVTYNFVP